MIEKKISCPHCNANATFRITTEGKTQFLFEQYTGNHCWINLNANITFCNTCGLAVPVPSFDEVEV